MYNILLYALTYCLPSLNNVYSGSLTIPYFGKQNIEFERLKANTSQVRLHGLINCDGLIYYNENNENNENINITNTMSYDLDNNLKNIMRKYRCSIGAPYYDDVNDQILFVLKINMLGITKSITLINVN